MKKIEEVYPEIVLEKDYFWSPSDYDPLLKSFEYEILLKIDDNGYQGDDQIIWKDNANEKPNILGIVTKQKNLLN